MFIGKKANFFIELRREDFVDKDNGSFELFLIDISQLLSFLENLPILGIEIIKERNQFILWLD